MSRSRAFDLLAIEAEPSEEDFGLGFEPVRAAPAPAPAPAPTAAPALPSNAYRDRDPLSLAGWATRREFAPAIAALGWSGQTTGDTGEFTEAYIGSDNPVLVPVQSATWEWAAFVAANGLEVLTLDLGFGTSRGYLIARGRTIAEYSDELNTWDKVMSTVAPIVANTIFTAGIGSAFGAAAAAAEFTGSIATAVVRAGTAAAVAELTDRPVTVESIIQSVVVPEVKSYVESIFAAPPDVFSPVWEEAVIPAAGLEDAILSVPAIELPGVETLPAAVPGFMPEPLPVSVVSFTAEPSPIPAFKAPAPMPEYVNAPIEPQPEWMDYYEARPWEKLAEPIIVPSTPAIVEVPAPAEMVQPAPVFPEAVPAFEPEATPVEVVIPEWKTTRVFDELPALIEPAPVYDLQPPPVEESIMFDQPFYDYGYEFPTEDYGIDPLGSWDVPAYDIGVAPPAVDLGGEPAPLDIPPYVYAMPEAPEAPIPTVTYTPTAPTASSGVNFDQVIKTVTNAATAAIGVVRAWEQRKLPPNPVARATTPTGSTVTARSDGTILTRDTMGRTTVTRPAVGLPQSTIDGFVVVNNGDGTFTRIDPRGQSQTLPYAAAPAGAAGGVSPALLAVGAAALYFVLA